MLDRIQQQFADSMFFAVGLTRNSRRQPLTRRESYTVEQLHERFLKAVEGGRREFERGARGLGILPEVMDGDGGGSGFGIVERDGRVESAWRGEGVGGGVSSGGDGVMGKGSRNAGGMGEGRREAVIVDLLGDGSEESESE